MFVKHLTKLATFGKIIINYFIRGLFDEPKKYS